MKTIRFLTISVFVVLYALPAVACLYPWCSCPIVTGQVSPIEADGSFRVWVERTDYPNNLSFTVHFRGGSSNYPLGDSRYITLWADCMTEPSELRIVPNDCGFNPYLPGEWATTIGGANLEPTVSLTVDKAFDPAESRMRSKATVTWDLGLYSNAWDVHVDALPWKNADGHVYAGSVLWSPDPVTRTGTEEFFFDTPSTAQQFTILAVAQSCTGRATQEASADCSPCDETASKDPVYFNDGNVRVTDGDPLPPIGGHRLVRTYNSDEQVIAPFGRGWTTLFDQRLIVNDDGGEEIVSIVTGTNEVVTFRGAPGAYRQTWPSRRTASGTLSYDSTEQTYAYRAPGSSEVAVFRTSDGRLIELGDRQTGRAATVEYSPEGLPATFTDSWTETEWEITSDPARRLVTSIVVTGRPELKWTYAYDASGNLTSIEAPGPTPWRSYVYAGNRMTASYDAAGYLIESHDYDANGYGVSSTGPSDEILSIEYNIATANPNERITRVTEKNGNVIDYVLAPSGGSWRTVRIEGGCGSCGTRDSSLARDPKGRVIRRQNADGYVTDSGYTGDRLTSTTTAMRPAGCNPETDVNRCRLDQDALAAAVLEPTAATLLTTYTYGDPLWPDRVTVMENPSVLEAGGVRREEYLLDPVTGARLTTTVRGWTGTPSAIQIRTTTTTLYGGSPAAFTPGGAFQAAWLSLPQPQWLPRSVNGPRLDVEDLTLFVYYPVDASVPALLRGQLAATRNAAGHVVRFENYDVFGNLTRIVDANGVVTESTFDAFGRVLTSTLKGIAGCDIASDPLCGTDLIETSTYSPAAGPLHTTQGAAGGPTVYLRDARGRIGIVARGPSAADLRELIETSYDPLTGKKSLEKTLANDAGVWVEKRRESFAYDGEGHLQTMTHADGAAVHYAYDAAGRIASVRDENHATPNTHYAYDPAGRLAQVTQTLAEAAGGVITTKYGYDRHGNLTSVTDPNGNVTTYTFDDFGQMLRQESPVTGVTDYTYDEVGLLQTTIDANGATTTRTCDVLGRVVFVMSSRSGIPSEIVQWVYDDHSSGRFGVGRLARMIDPAGVTAYSYQRQGLLRREERFFTGLTEPYVTSFRYDGNGHRTVLNYPSGMNLVYTLDFAGRPVSLDGSSAAGSTTLITTAAYLPFGPLTTLGFGNGTTQSLSFDSRYRVMQNKLSAATGTVAQYDYDYDPAGNITEIHDALDGGYDRDFGYDDLHRLRWANTGTNLWRTGSYSYDAMGNLESVRLGEVISAPDGMARRPRVDASTLPLGRVTSFAYDGTSPKLASVTNNDLLRPVTYDAAGNELSHAVQRTYSARNLLASVIEPLEELTHRIDYAYDGRGVRVKRSEPPAAGGNSSRYYTYSPELTLLSVTEDDEPNPWVRGPVVQSISPAVKTEIIWFAGRPIAQVNPAPLVYTFADHLGTPILQTAWNAATITWQAEYEPFGNIYEMRAGSRTEQPLRFPGQEVAMTHEGQEENYNIHRWYRSDWGRYTQADPIGILGKDPFRDRRRGMSERPVKASSWTSMSGESRMPAEDLAGGVLVCEQLAINVQGSARTLAMPSIRGLPRIWLHSGPRLATWQDDQGMCLRGLLRLGETEICRCLRKERCSDRLSMPEVLPTLH